MADDVVITGMGVVTPIGVGETAFWEALTNGQTGAAEVTSFDTSELTRTLACQVKEDLPLSQPPGRASRLAVLAAQQALRDANLDAESIAASRVDVCVGTTMGETVFIENSLDDPDEQWLSHDHLQQISLGRPGVISRSVAEAVGATGSAYDLFGACAAGNMSLASARRKILSGSCDMVLAGGADGFSRLAFIGFMRLRVMAETCCRPFDEKRDGLFVGEGAGLFVVESSEHARRRGARVRARVSGGAVTAESYHPTRPHPEGDGLTRATIEALHDAQLNSSDIGYVCAHGTGTPQNDAIEAKVMQHCFPVGVSFSSIKSLTGHTMGAAAAIEAAVCVLSLERQMLIPTWYLSNPLDVGNLDPVMAKPRSQSVQHVVNNSAGFGGYNSSVVLSAA